MADNPTAVLPPPPPAAPDPNSTALATNLNAMESSLVLLGRDGNLFSRERLANGLVALAEAHAKAAAAKFKTWQSKVDAELQRAAQRAAAATEERLLAPLARGAEDLEIAMDVMAGPDAIDGRGWKLSLPKAWPCCACWV